LGDGRLSSWVVAFIEKTSLVEVQVFADGREPVIRYHDLLYSHRDETVYIEIPLDILDSDEAARQAAADPTFQGHVALHPGAGFVYTKLRDDFRYTGSERTQDSPDELPAESEPAGDEDDRTRADFLGWPVFTGAWSVVHFPLDEVEAMVQASVGADGRLLDVRLHRPVYLSTVADESLYLPEPVPPSIGRSVHRLNFTVPRGAEDLTGTLYVPTPVDREYNLRVLAPDGSVFFDSEGMYPSLHVREPEPMAGNWTVEVTHTVPVSEPPPVAFVTFDRYLIVELEATVPLLAAR
jgi:hypothetical protein